MAVPAQLLGIILDAAHNLFDVDGRRFQRHFSRLNFGHVQHIVDEVEKNLRVVGNLC